MDLYNNGLPDTIYPKNSCFGDVKGVFSTMKGHLCTVTGIPSHGKSTFLEWYILNLVNDHKMKASFFSPEHHPMNLHQTGFIQKAIGRNFWKEMDGLPRISAMDIDRYRDWANERIYLTGAEKGILPDWDWILEKFKEQLFTYGIDIFVIDAFNKIDLPKGNKLDGIGSALTRLTMFAQMNNVMVILVAHPTKMKKNEVGIYEMPTLYDVSGSADFRNQTHDGFCVYRYFGSENGAEDYTEFKNLKTKFSFQGDIGSSINYTYHKPSGRYYLKGTTPPTFDMTLKKQTQMRASIDDHIDKIDDWDDQPF